MCGRISVGTLKRKNYPARHNGFSRDGKPGGRNEPAWPERIYVDHGLACRLPLKLFDDIPDKRAMQYLANYLL